MGMVTTHLENMENLEKSEFQSGQGKWKKSRETKISFTSVDIYFSFMLVV